MACPFGLTKDGIESQFGTNHVGHFLLTRTLMPSILKAGKGARIVNVSSVAHVDTPPKGIDFDAITNSDEKAMTNWQRYAVSKLCNIHFTHELNKRYGDKGIYTNCLHPGFVRTELLRGPFGEGFFGRILKNVSVLLTRPVSIDAPRGALTSLYLATSNEVEERDIKDRYYTPLAKDSPEQLTDVAKDYELASKLWTFTEDLLKSKGL
jgi:NAD(P)-dependent dehydrogenase (short-subunit alcohol dehydrogenase family)